MDTSFLLIALVLVSLVGYMAYAKSQRDQRTFSSLYRPADERLLSEQTELDEKGSIAFEGDFGLHDAAFFDDGGRLQVNVLVSQLALVQVELYSEDGSDKEVIAIKSGEGEVGFSVDSSGRYFCKIEPAKDDRWEIEIAIRN